MANRTLIGDFGGGDYRIRVSKPGFDVTAALDPERLAFDSAWKDGATVYRIGTVAIPDFSNFSHYVQYDFGETLPVIPYVYCWKYSSSTKVISGGLNTSSTSHRPYPIYLSSSWIRFGPDDFVDGVSESYTVGFMILRSSGNG